MSEGAEKHEQQADAPPPPETAPEAESVDTEALTRSAGRGALWNIAGGGWSTLVRLGASTVLARVLFPEDFGIMGMAMLAQGLITRFGDLGMGTGIIAKKDVTEDDLSTAFWTTLAVKVFLFGVALAAAPLFAWFFETPALTWVLRVTCIGFLFAGLASVSGTLLTKRLQFGRLVIIEGAGALVSSGLAVTFAVVYGLGYWSLVLAMVIGNGAMSLARIVVAGWRPGLRFSRESFRFQFRYGINGLAFNIINYFHQNLDYLLVGRLLGPSLLGLYEFAYRIPHLVLDRVARPVGSVVFPTLSKVQSSDERLVAGYVKTARYIGLIVFPALAGLAALAHPTVAVLWGEKWLPVVVPLQLLCLAAGFRCIVSPAGAIFLCKNRPDLPVKLAIAALVATVAAVGTLGWLYGLVGVAAGVCISTLPYFVTLWLAFRLTNSSPIRLLRALVSPLVGAGASGVIAYVTSTIVHLYGGETWLALVCGVPLGASACLASLFAFCRQDVAEAYDTMKILIGRSKAVERKGF